jgi:hypothetical protein
MTLFRCPRITSFGSVSASNWYPCGPACGAAPVATIFQDSLMIIIYFVVMTSLPPV